MTKNIRVEVVKGEPLFTQEELDKAVRAEREACKNNIETVKQRYTYLFAGVCDDCVDSIIARGE